MFSGCELNPCLNGGVCVQSGQNRTCVCPSNTTGTYCENCKLVSIMMAEVFNKLSLYLAMNSCSLDEATASFLSNLVVRRRHLGTSQFLPAMNCAEIKSIRREAITGVYWIMSTNGTSILAFCQYL